MADLSDLPVLPGHVDGPPASGAGAWPPLDQVLMHLPQALALFDKHGALLLANAAWQAHWPSCRSAGTAGQPAHPAGQPGLLRQVWTLPDGQSIGVMSQRLPQGSVLRQLDALPASAAIASPMPPSGNDSVTGLPQRAALEIDLNAALAGAAGSGETALLYLNLDGFKAVNDLLGHHAGDALLAQLADRLRQAVRAGDPLVHMGADEFAVVQTQGPQPASAIALARRLQATVGQVFWVAGQTVQLKAGIGLAVAPFDAQDASSLLNCADAALSEAKAAGAGALRCFEPAMERRRRLRHQTSQDLRGALEAGELELAFQAQVALATDNAVLQVVGVEALLRWNHPTRGRVSPAEFIPIAEQTGHIVPIGRWVLQQACAAASAWPASVHIAVNVSPVQFKSRSLVQDVRDALQASGLQPHRLEVEVTEAVLLDDTEMALSVLHALRDMGVRLSLDDFGTGYSSLSYLRRFPFDRLKIDRSFVVDAALGGDAMAIVQAVCDLGRSLGMATTAEGVETPAQLRAVMAAGCEDVQGFLFSRPVPAAEMALLVASGVRPPATPAATASPW